MKEMTSEMKREQISKDCLILFGATVLAVTLASFNGATIGWVRARIAPDYVLTPLELHKHSAFLANHNPKARFIVMTGTCEALSVWPARNKIDERNPIARQLDLEFKAHGMKNVSVLNLATGGYSAAHNLHIFLRFLDDPRYRIFIWQNDLDTVYLRRNRLAYNDYVHSRLYGLQRRYPGIPEIPALLKKLSDHRKYIQISDLGQVPPEIPTSTNFADVFNSFQDSIVYLRDHLFAVDQYEQIRLNTFYLRELERRLARFRFRTLPYSPEPNALLDDDRTSYEYKHPDFGIIRTTPPEKASEDSILTLRLIAKLAAIKGKRIFVYFGPEGRLTNQENMVYVRKFKIPVLNAVRDMPAVRIIDLTDLPITPQDTWASINPTFSGSHKIAEAMFNFIYPDAKILLQ